MRDLTHWDFVGRHRLIDHRGRYYAAEFGGTDCEMEDAEFEDAEEALTVHVGRSLTRNEEE